MEKIGSRLKVLAILLAIMFAALTTRLWFLQVLATEANQQAARDVSRRTTEIEAPRGRIFDASGRPLVLNIPSRQLRINKEILAESGRTDEVVERLSSLLEMPVDDIREKLDSTRYLDSQPKPIADFIPKDVGWNIKEFPDAYPGVSVATTTVRSYPQEDLAANLLGWTGQIPPGDLESPSFKGYGSNDTIGLSGVERTYESFLRGTKGQNRSLVNREGQWIQALPGTDPVPGDDLYLTVDRDVQRYATEELSRGITYARLRSDSLGRPYRATAGVALVMDMRGGIVAEVSYPSYDPRWFVEGLTSGQNRFLFGKTSSGPTLNRAVSLTYLPGSTFKPFVSLVASREGLADFNGGTYSCPNEYFAPTDVEELTPFGNASVSDGSYLSVAQALVSSCDTVFYPWGYKFWWDSKQTGYQDEPFQKGLHDLGFGELTGVDLPREERGVVPDAKWAETQSVLEYGWDVPGPSILLSIGSGYVNITPLQLANAYVTLANGGRRCTPHVVGKVKDPDEGLVKKVEGDCESVPFSKKDIAYVRNALAGVTHPGGTAGSAFLGFPFDQVTVAGKTGTAVRDDGNQFQDTSWFAAMVPAENPKYVVMAMVEEGGFGAETAAPIVRHIIERMYGIGTSGFTGAPVAD
jgi:penicillin-binding protein 2